MRLTPSLVVLLSGLALLALGGCKKARPNAATRTDASMTHPTTSPSSQPASVIDAAVDRDVLDAILADLLSLKESPLATQKAPPAEIRLSTAPSRYPITAAGILQRHEEKNWATLSPAQLAAATEAANDVVRRHEQRASAAPFEPRDPRVKLEAAGATRPSTFEPPALAHAPGYSADGKTAVVSLILPWSMHHADATYVLARAADGWRVVLRQFIYYV